MKLAQELHTLACTTAREAAALALRRQDDVHSVETKASDIDIVTEVDRACEELIVERLLDARPHDGVLAEEGTGIASSSGVDWVVDPIDGTTSYFYGLPGFSVSIAARVDGEVVAGCVCAPAIDAEYSAVAGSGALLAARGAAAATMRCTDATELPKALIASGFSPDHDRRIRQGRAFAEIIPRIRDLRRMGSAALDLAAVGSGQVDGYFEIGLSIWDYAAGVLIASQAGAVTVVEVDPVTGRAFVLAAAPGIADELLELVRTVGADRVSVGSSGE